MTTDDEIKRRAREYIQREAKRGEIHSEYSYIVGATEQRAIDAKEIARLRVVLRECLDKWLAKTQRTTEQL